MSGRAAYLIRDYVDRVYSKVNIKDNPCCDLEAFGYLMFAHKEMTGLFPEYEELFNGVLREAGKTLIEAVDPSDDVADTLSRIVGIQTADEEEEA